ncbi:hypothetical protein DLE01_03080 [Streptomyces sp. FT05W]|nr:hypothetical protein DLE01_03080 [Streptomyces sp. FT05W]
MRDEVFRVGPRTKKGERPRDVDLDGELWFLLMDLMLNKGQPRALSESPSILRQIGPQLREYVWVLEPGHLRPMAVWVVNEAGRAHLAEVLPSREGRRRRAVARGATRSRPPG